MTIEARLNYQKGKPEDKNIEAYNYTIESDLDRFIVSRKEAKNKILENAEIESAIAEQIESIIEGLFK